MPSHEWTATVRQVNQRIKRDAPLVGGKSIRIRVSARIRSDGSRPIDVLGHWGNASGPTTRRLTAVVTPGAWQQDLQTAGDEAIELARQEASGLPVSVQVRTIGQPKPASGQLGRQIQAAEQKIQLRQENRRITAKTTGYHLRWLHIVQAYCEETSTQLSMAAAAQALLAHYGGDRSRKSYANAISTMRWVLTGIGLPIDLADQLLPTYHYEPTIHELPSDQEFADRLMAIPDPADQKLIYSIVVYGHRIMQIHSCRWDQRKPDGRIPYYAYKTGRRCVGYPIPFADEQIDLSGWVPPRHEILKCYDKRPTGALKDLHDAESAVLSDLVFKHLGHRPTALRHRWGSVAIRRNIFPNLALIARCMGTSSQMLEATYAQELDSMLMGDDPL